MASNMFGFHLKIDPPGDTSATSGRNGGGGGGGDGMNVDDAGSSDDANTPLHSPRSRNTSRDEDDEESSNANESDCKSPSQSCRSETDDRQRYGDSAKVATQSWKNLRAVMAYYHSLRKIKRTKSNQRWMKLRTTVQISSAISQKKPPLKREDSFLQRFSTRQIPETQETVEDTGSEGGGGQGGDARNAPRRRRRQRKQPRTVVNPDENFYFHWLLVLTICVLYNMWTLIVRQSFPELQRLISTFWLFCDSISDIVFILDVVVQLRTGYLEQGLMVYDSKKLAKHYLRSRAFLLDLAALCPLDLLQIRFGPQPLLRFPRFFKVYRAVNYYYMVESRTVWPNLWRVVNLIHILLILAHWFGCFYYLLSEAEGFQGDWVYPYRPGDYATLTRKYLGSLYWSTLTLTTIGDLPTPETNAEYIFTIVSYLIGVFIFATIVGQVGNVITNRNANRLEFERLLDGAKTYMRHHKVPGGMKRRVLRWYDYSWSRGRIQGGGDINTALGLLPDKLKTELALHVNLSVLKKVTIFQECQPEFLRDLVLKMKAYIFTPGDSICRKGEVAREMFIIADGILEVLSETGKVLTTMKAGDFFGEIGILNLDGLNKRTADVRSVGYSELFSLSREDVLAAMKDYPEAQEILQALGRKRLMEVKASARQHAHSKDHHHHVGQHFPDPKGLVDKIKNEAKMPFQGLRNVLRKSRTHRRSDESLELQPLHIPETIKGPLKRMQRVKSHDLSQEEPAPPPDPPPAVQPPTSPLGAGLPLLARLRLLKEKQEHEERAKSATPPVLSPGSVKSPPPIPEEGEPPLLQRILKLREKEDGNGERRRVSLRDRLRLHKDHGVKEEPSTSRQTSVSDSLSGRDEPPWRKLKKAAIGNNCGSDAPEKCGEVGNKRSLMLTRRTKHYRSIDDLSPEYGGLPFVKKLKILNERQKLEELETVMKTRSFSLDIPDTQQQLDTDTLTRSHSEGSTMHRGVDNLQLSTNSIFTNSESNETLERRHLKSILKKLSEDGTNLAEPPNRVDSLELRRLMRAPTIEGYAARHSKLAKSVTFNRDTLQSPPNGGVPEDTGGEDTGVVAVVGEGEVLGGGEDRERVVEAKRQELERVGLQLFSGKGNQVKFIKGSLEEEQQYFADILCAIKQVMSAHLQEVQDKFQQRFERLEQEVRSKDEIIDQLKKHIVELEAATDSSFTDSIETVVGSHLPHHHQYHPPHHHHQPQWNTSAASAETLADIPDDDDDDHLGALPRHHPHPNQQRRRSLSPRSASVVLDMDSATDTESEQEQQSGGYESGELENTNWELEMLVAQMRRQRSASLDHGRPVRRRLTRGGSEDKRRV